MPPVKVSCNLTGCRQISVCFHVYCGYLGLLKFLWTQSNQISMQRVFRKSVLIPPVEMGKPTYFLLLLH